MKANFLRQQFNLWVLNPKHFTSSLILEDIIEFARVKLKVQWFESSGSLLIFWVDLNLAFTDLSDQ